MQTNIRSKRSIFGLKVGNLTMMLPLLELAGDSKEYKLAEAIELLATHFNLTDIDRKELLPSGKQARFANRVGWATTYLKKAGLLTYPTRGKFQIAPRGLETLIQKPVRIDIKYLKQFPEYLDFVGAVANVSEAANAPVDRTPDEVMAAAYEELHQNLA